MDSIPKVSIGMPIYNGEQFVKKRLENILAQTFTDFELIILDDSNDLTPLICQEYANRDKRISYTRNEKRSGWVIGFLSVLEKAKGAYFTWAAVDDIWELDFLEKNVQILDSNPNAVSSNGKHDTQGPAPYDEFKSEDDDSQIKRIYKRIRRTFRPRNNTISTSGSYKERATIILRNTNYWHIYGVHRTKKLQESAIKNEMFVWDWATMLNLLKHGNFYAIDKTLCHIHTDFTTTRKGIFNQLSVQNTRINEYFFPYSTFTFWCMKNIGIRFFIKNIDYFLWLNFTGGVALLIGIFQLLRPQKISKGVKKLQ